MSAIDMLGNAGPVLSATLSRTDTTVSTDVRTGPQQGWRGATKRVFDVAAVCAGMVVVLPVLLLVALAIKLQDGGPVLFRQTRIGRNGQPFTIYKFRTMVTDAESRLAAIAKLNESAEHLFKMRHDPRVTGVGRVLRRLSLDELPQLLNVLDGTMSLVGPRPHLAAEVAQMGAAGQQRALVAPGITGLWQISGRSDLDESTSIALDLRYVERWSLLLDLRILVGTVSAVLSARGAH